VDIREDYLNGRIAEYTQIPLFRPVRQDKPNRYSKRYNLDQRFLLNEVHLYVNEYSEAGSRRINIPFRSISRIDLYDHDTATTVGTWFLAALGAGALAMTGCAVLFIIFKESCPFIYIWDGMEYSLCWKNAENAAESLYIYHNLFPGKRLPD